MGRQRARHATTAAAAAIAPWTALGCGRQCSVAHRCDRRRIRIEVIRSKMSEPQEPPDAAPDDVDVPGLAGERTDLAWTRTALAAGVAATAMIRRSWAVVDTVTGRVA